MRGGDTRRHHVHVPRCVSGVVRSEEPQEQGRDDVTQLNTSHNH